VAVLQRTGTRRPCYRPAERISLVHPVAGKVVRAGEKSSGVRFEPQKLKTEEVRRLIVAAAA
jgi:hypothetical protein